MAQEAWNTLMEQLLGRQTSPALKPEHLYNAELDNQIASLAGIVAEQERGGGHGTAGDERAFFAGLHLWNESLDRSHRLSQDIDNDSCSYWHGIMHRMEGDYSNAKYWFRVTGSHPAMREVQERAAAWLAECGLVGEPAPDNPRSAALYTIAAQVTWDPFLFVDEVAREVQAGNGADQGQALAQLQRIEMDVLLRYCYTCLQDC